MSPNKLILLVVFVLLSGMLIAVFPAVDVLSKNQLEPCLKSGCFKLAGELFAESIDIIKNAGLIAAYLAAMVGSYIGFRTFSDSLKRDSYSRHAANLVDFKVVVAELLQGSVIERSCLNVNKFYAAIYPGSRMGDVSVSRSYVKLIEDIALCVKSTSAGYGGSGAGLRAEHLDEMLNSMSKLGITIEEPDFARLVELEPGLFSFLDSVNLRLTDVDLKLSDLRRDYKVHFS